MSDETSGSGGFGGAEPTLEALIAAMTGGLPDSGGWGDLDTKTMGVALAKMRNEQRQAMKRQADLFRDVFLDNPQGRKLLELLLDNTLRKVAWPVMHMQNAEMLMAYGIWREAENAFVAAIVEAIAVAENHEVKTRDDPT